MSGNRPTRSIASFIPTVVLLLTAVCLIGAGIAFALLPVLVRFGNGGGPSLNLVAFGAALVLGGLVLVWFARRGWASRPH
jgi:hydrogenase-4 membrane subunit HyfE